jgi:hypothetical protein
MLLMSAIVATIAANAARSRVIIIVMFKFLLPDVASHLRSQFPGAPPLPRPHAPQSIVPSLFLNREKRRHVPRRSAGGLDKSLE